MTSVGAREGKIINCDTKGRKIWAPTLYYLHTSKTRNRAGLSQMLNGTAHEEEYRNWNIVKCKMMHMLVILIQRYRQWNSWTDHIQHWWKWPKRVHHQSSYRPAVCECPAWLWYSAQLLQVHHQSNRWSRSIWYSCLNNVLNYQPIRREWPCPKVQLLSCGYESSGKCPSWHWGGISSSHWSRLVTNEFMCLRSECSFFHSFTGMQCNSTFSVCKGKQDWIKQD